MGMEKQAGMKALVRPSLNPCPRQILREYRLYIPGMFDSVVVGFGLKCRERLEWDSTLHASFLSTVTRVETCTTSFRSPKAVSNIPSFRGGMPLHPSIHPSHSRSPGISQEVPPRSHGRLVLPFEICLKPCKAPVFLLV